MTLDITGLLAQSRDRGRRRAEDDRAGGYRNDSPLSGEWAGESPIELLGDLFAEAARLWHVANGTTDQDDLYWSDVAELSEIESDICDDYLAGYSDVFADSGSVD